MSIENAELNHLLLTRCPSWSLSQSLTCLDMTETVQVPGDNKIILVWNVEAVFKMSDYNFDNDWLNQQNDWFPQVNTISMSAVCMNINEENIVIFELTTAQVGFIWNGQGENVMHTWCNYASGHLGTKLCHCLGQKYIFSQHATLVRAAHVYLVYTDIYQYKGGN